MDFQDPADANKAVDCLQTNGVQAQFAKVRIDRVFIVLCGYLYIQLLLFREIHRQRGGCVAFCIC